VVPFATAEEADRAKGSYVLRFNTTATATTTTDAAATDADAATATAAADDATTPAATASTSPGMDAVAAAAAMPAAFRDLVAITHPLLLSVDLPKQARDEQWALDEAAAFTWPGAGLDA